jgi:hypothetical protein
MKEHVYSKLQIGDVWLIPDEISGFSNKGAHPWIVVRTCRMGILYAELSPRTTKYRGAKRGIITPAGVLPELDQKGLILLKHRRKFFVDLFRDLTYVGRLPENWVQEIKVFLSRI